MTKLLHRLLLLFAVLPIVLLSSGSAQAAVWSGNREMADCDGNACLTVDYSIDLSGGDGMRLTKVKIAAAPAGPLNNYQGTLSKGLSCWNDNNVVKWSKTPVESSLNHGEVKYWLPGQNWLGTESITCGYYFTDVYVVGPNENHCAKVKALHDGGDGASVCASGIHSKHLQPPLLHFSIR